MSASPPPKKLTVIFKITERCNLACSYCYFFFGGDTSYKERPPVVQDEVIEGLSRFLVTGADAGVERVDIIFHGGEPLLMPKRRFREMCSRLRGALAPRLALQFGIQTNGVLIDPEWIELLSEFSVIVGVSLDGPQPIHDLHRVDHRGRGSHARILSNWFQLRDAAAAGKLRPPGILCVMNPATDGGEVYRHFVDDLHARSIDFLFPDVAPGQASQAPGGVADGIEQYVLAIFHEWVSSPDKRVLVRFLAEIFAPLANDAIARATTRRTIDYRGLISVSSNGEVGPHDVLRSFNPQWARPEINVFEHSVQELMGHAIWQAMRSAAATLPEPCQPCSWRNFCKGGNLEHRLGLNRNELRNRTVYCGALKAIYSEMTAHLVRGGISIADIATRLGLDDDDVPAPAPEGAAASAHLRPLT